MGTWVLCVEEERRKIGTENNMEGGYFRFTLSKAFDMQEQRTKCSQPAWVLAARHLQLSSNEDDRGRPCRMCQAGFTSNRA